MQLYPLTMAPFYRSGKDTPWGGSMLRDAFMKDAPESAGESLEVSVILGMESMVLSGVCAGRTLTSVANLLGEELTGAGVSTFPFTVKLIDVDYSAEPVSTVMSASRVWVILNCEPGVEITIGESNVAVRPGDVYYIAAGLNATVPAGMQVYEVSAAAPASVSSKPERIFGTTALCKGGSRTYYVSDPSIELCRLNVFGKMPLDDDRMLALTPFAPCALTAGEETIQLQPFCTVLIPAALKDIYVESDDCKIMMASVSERNALKVELSYRAETVVGLTD